MIKIKLFKLSLIACLLLTSQLLFAQSSGASTFSPYNTLVALVIIFFIAAVVTLANRLMKMTAQRVGADKDGANFSVIPTKAELFGDFFGAPKPSHVGEENYVALSKGYDIPLAGAAQKHVDSSTAASTFAIKPIDIPGMAPIPKLAVKEGETVKAGDVVFFDKTNPAVKYVAPVSGEIISVNRGPKRRIDEIVILADKDISYKSFNPVSLDNRGKVVEFLLESGGFSLLRQRPYNVAATPDAIPTNIFVSTFDSAPLAPDLNFVIQGKEAAFQKGLDVLRTLTNGQVHLGLDASKEVSPAFANATGVKKTYFNGKHPVGNVGIQIHHTTPINKGEVVWTIDVQAVATIGTLFLEGKYDASRVVALTGAELKDTKYLNTYQGASISTFVKGNTTSENLRYVSGDVLTGTQIEAKGFLGFHDDQITVLTEGDYYEAFGWLIPAKPRASISPTIPMALYPKELAADTNTHGEKRAFVVTGQYESVLPMDIYPQHLLKAILVNDLERMEGLGIYEVVEEDFALCEFACTSKQDIQAILRQGLDMMREQG